MKTITNKLDPLTCSLRHLVCELVESLATSLFRASTKEDVLLLGGSRGGSGRGCCNVLSKRRGKILGAGLGDQIYAPASLELRIY